MNTNATTSCLFEVTAIMSLRTLACGIGAPAIFTLVSNYLIWMVGIVWREEYEAPTTTAKQPCPGKNLVKSIRSTDRIPA